jgi:MinD superfamily P-loop ATPase
MTSGLTIAVASGKGGTGKTTLSVNLAWLAAESGLEVTYADCDVEEPNGHLFLKPDLTLSKPAHVAVPSVDMEKCTGCGACGEICQYSAIVCLGREVVIFDKMCHGCGGCALACPGGAIQETKREIGVVEKGKAGKVHFIHGRLNIGEAMSPPLIKAVRAEARRDSLVILDAPPGTSCPVVKAVSGADFVVLVTEPTPFGLHDLGLALDMVQALGIPHAVAVNRSDPENSLARDFCRRRGVKILAEVPDRRSVAEAYSRGEMAYNTVPGFKNHMADLFASIRKEVGQ